MIAIGEVIADLALLVFVAGNMLGAGLRLTVREILLPLRNARLMAGALVYPWRSSWARGVRIAKASLLDSTSWDNRDREYGSTRLGVLARSDP